MTKPNIKVKIELTFSKLFSLLVFLGCLYLDLKITKNFTATAMGIPFCSALIMGKQYNDRIKLKNDSINKDRILDENIKEDNTSCT